MKRTIKIFILFLFVLNFSAMPSLNINKNFCVGLNENYHYSVFFDGYVYDFYDKDFSLDFSKIQKKNYHNIKLIKKFKKLGLSDEEILTYLFPETKQIISKFSERFNIDEISDSVIVKENQCKLEFIDGRAGKVVNKQKFFKDCLSQIESGKKELDINIEIIDYKKSKKAKDLFLEKSSFSTSFSLSTDERKNNIKLAMKSLDGLVVDEGEIFSFNQITGKRSVESGYKEAKIISGGTFVLGAGGGVCQVSTTLFNACVLADLEIIEANTHSLPVSYVEPSFDAMVSFGSSDLKFRNNSGGKIIITTSSENDICKIKIFGLKNKYKIIRESEKVSVIPSEKDIVDTDYKKYGYYGLEVGEEKRISYAKDGLVSRAYLNYYDETGRLVKRKKIRETRYNPTRGVIIKREK